jgi:hypothetical protein
MEGIEHGVSLSRYRGCYGVQGWLPIRANANVIIFQHTVFFLTT